MEAVHISDIGRQSPGREPGIEAPGLQGLPTGVSRLVAKSFSEHVENVQKTNLDVSWSRTNTVLLKSAAYA